MYGGPANGLYIKLILAADNLLWFSTYDIKEKGVYSRPLITGKWYHITCTFKNGEVKIYVNAVLHNTNILGGNMTPSSQLITLGKRATSSSSYTNMLIDEFTFHNTDTPWTQAQINDVCFRNIIPSGAVQYGMNDVATDQNGANGLTLSGTSYSTDVPLRTRTAI